MNVIPVTIRRTSELDANGLATFEIRSTLTGENISNRVPYECSLVDAKTGDDIYVELFVLSNTNQHSIIGSQPVTLHIVNVHTPHVVAQ